MKSMEEMMQGAQAAAETIQMQIKRDVQGEADRSRSKASAGGGLVKVRASAKGRILGRSGFDGTA